MYQMIISLTLTLWDDPQGSNIGLNEFAVPPKSFEKITANTQEGRSTLCVHIMT